MKQNRIRLLDVLRGFAIIGTLGTNIWLFAQPGNIMGVFSNENWWESFASFLTAFLSVFVNGKFLSLLTILFGIGLELKYRKAMREGLPWIRMYLWTMLLLLLDGLLHFIFVFEYDILMSYALTGMIVAFIIRYREEIIKRSMIVSAIIHFTGIILVSIGWVFLIKDEVFLSEMTRMSHETTQLYANQSYWQQIQFRMNDFWGLRIEAILIIFMNITLYILGIRLFRAGAFSNNDKAQRIRKKLMIYGLGIGIPLNLLTLVPGGFFDIASRYVFAPILALGYIGLFAWVLQKAWAPWLIKRFESIGKTALSCYILQNILASIIFYGWGLSMAPLSSAYVVILLWILLTIVMMGAAELFVKYIGTGPLEYLWRKLSYSPFKK
ncbi:DUF418 domain-containing protein [Gracilibacillus phocaeensis]|uniref:DUF418 domain-containing protein n=1 Tax=Gracilibacillus phocaeensis TaxID=2042304 RepID=UPI0010320618|nr:DUF418 domain-containing protein [Gracilibacillus phocaeensis]